MKPLAITCGDPAGVGPEVIASWAYAHRESLDDAVFIGHPSWRSSLPPCAFAEVGDPHARIIAGTPSTAACEVARDALVEAASGCREGRYRGVVTGPVSKSGLNKIGWNYPGQTEFFADQWYGTPSMAFAGGKLTVLLATWHIPLAQVPAAVDRPCLERAVAHADFLARRLGAKAPRIAVCGINPHAGEEGLLGSEEVWTVDPILNDLRRTYPGLSTTLPGDTVFWRQLQGEFDVVIAMYHDQGLAPVKTIDFEASVNLTLGLPFIRTSPDHGTAYGIAGKGLARATSFTNAFDLARKLTFSV